VRFLVDPAVARKRLREGTRLLPADQVESLHPALRSVLEGQPEYASWIPSSLCFIYVDAVHVSGRRYGNKNPRKLRMLGAWTLASAQEENGVRRDLVLDLFGTGGDLVRAAGLTGVKLREAGSAVSKVANTGNDLLDIKVGKTRLVWNGRAAGDSTRVEQPIQESWLTRNTRGSVRRGGTILDAEWSRPLVGALSVEGKDDLAKALKASPTRFVGPVYYGGEGQLHF
jgi:hypothetical protein